MLAYSNMLPFTTYYVIFKKSKIIWKYIIITVSDNIFIFNNKLYNLRYLNIRLLYIIMPTKC